MVHTPIQIRNLSLAFAHKTCFEDFSTRAKNPDLLLLDEPTNHLDLHNRKSLMRMLNAYHGTVLIVSHDIELLQKCIDTIWHIDSQSY